MSTLPRLSLAALLALLPLSACEKVTKLPSVHRVESFHVEVKSVEIHGATSQERFEAWTPEAPLPLPRVGALIEVEVSALDEKGVVAESFENPISFRVTPGVVIAAGPQKDLSAEMATKKNLLNTTKGIARGFVWVEKTFGETRLWAQDSPPPPQFQLPMTEEDEYLVANDAGLDGGLDLGFDAGLDLGFDAGELGPPPGLDAGPDSGWIEPDGGRTFAAGTSAPIWFSSPTLGDIQALPAKEIGIVNPPHCGPSSPSWNNKTSPFVANFLTVQATRPAGDMIVTALAPDGFYLTDRLAAPINDPFYTEDPTRNRTLAGTFAHMFVYNYNFAEGLFLGDRLLSLTGTVQEFTGDTQIVFPSWHRKEGLPRPEDRPAPQLLDFASYKDSCNQGDPQSSCDSGGGATSGSFNSYRCIWNATGTSATADFKCGAVRCEPGFVCEGGKCVCKGGLDDTCAATYAGTHCDTASNTCVGGCPATPCEAGQWCVQRRCVNPNRPCEGAVCKVGETCNALTGACECGASLGYRLAKTPTWNAVPAPGADVMTQLFAYSNNNVEIETLESSVVRIYNARPSTVFASCDANGNSRVPTFFWQVPSDDRGCPNFDLQHWECGDSGADTAECPCNRDCVLGRGRFSGPTCSPTLRCLPASDPCASKQCPRLTPQCVASDGAASCRCTATSCGVGNACVDGVCRPVCEGVSCAEGETCNSSDGQCKCDATSCPAGKVCSLTGRCVEATDPCAAKACEGATPVCTAAGGAAVCGCHATSCPAASACVDGACVPGSRCEGVSCAEGETCDPTDGRCKCSTNSCPATVCSETTTLRSFGQWLVELEPHWHTRIAVQTRDALPDFDPREFSKPEYQHCRIDVTGLLRQVSAARPRWVILARDEQDVCCRPEPGAKCPTPENGGACPKCPDAQQ